MDVFTGLATEWAHVASTGKARHALQAWALRAPGLAGFATPADLVATIARLGHPGRSCTLLAELLAIGGDDLAARAVLQAIIPGLRHAAARRWQNTLRTGGPWRTATEVAGDAVSAAWEIIEAHRGQHHQRPAAVIIRPVERRLRQTHDRWRRDTRRTTPLEAVHLGLSQSGTDAAYSGEYQAATTIADAQRLDVIDPIAAVILYSTGVLGHPMDEVEHALAVPPGSGYRTAARGRTALREWHDSSPRLAYTTPRHRGGPPDWTILAVEVTDAGADGHQRRPPSLEPLSQTQRHQPDRDRTPRASGRHDNWPADPDRDVAVGVVDERTAAAGPYGDR